MENGVLKGLAKAKSLELLRVILFSEDEKKTIENLK